MGLKALKIVQEEFDKEIEHQDRNENPRMAAMFRVMKVTLVDRIEAECVEVDPKALLRDHMRKGGDPATFDPFFSDKSKCTWCNCGADAVDDFWVREVGEFRDSKESLCSNHVEELESARPPISVRRVT